jgi:hypothetical protein
MHSIIYTFASHVDSTTLADGDYQLIPEPEGGYFEDPGNLIAEFSEAPNQGSEDINLTNPSPPTKASPGHNLYFITLQTILFIYIFMH